MNKTHSPSRILIACLAAASLCLQTPYFFAADFTWDGEEGDGLLMSGNNWTGTPDNTAPSSGNTIAFSGNVGISSGNGSVNNDFDPTTFIFGGIDFENDFAIAGNIPFILSGNAIRLDGDITSTVVASGNSIIDEINTGIILGANSTFDLGNNHGLSVTGNISETGGSFSLTKAGQGRLFLSGNNTFSGGLFILQDDLGITSAESLGSGNITLQDNGDAPVLDINAGGVSFDITNDIIFDPGGSQGGAKIIRLDEVPDSSVSISGDIFLNDTSNTQQLFRVNTGDVLTLTGNLRGSNGFSKDNTSGAGTLVISNDNSATLGGTIRIEGGTLAVTDDNALGSTLVVIRDDGSTPNLEIRPGVNLSNNVRIDEGNQGGAKQIRLQQGFGGGDFSAELSGDININNESTNGEFTFDLNGEGTTNSTTNSTLTLSGDIISTSGAGLNIADNGILILSGNNNITDNINLVGNARNTLRVATSTALGTESTNTVTLTRRNTLSLMDGVVVSDSTSLQLNNNASNEVTLQLFDGNTGVQEQATFAGNIQIDRTAAETFDISVADDPDILNLTGTISGAGGIDLNGDGFLVISGDNDFSGGVSGGDNGSTTVDIDGDGNSQGFLVLGNNNALGTGILTARGAQIRASTGGLNFGNEIIVEGGALRLGGANDFELSGNITRQGGSGLGHYGLDGVTYTLSGDIDLAAGGLVIQGTDGKDNGTLILSGVISDGLPGNSTNSFSLTLDDNFDDGDVTLAGINTWTGRTILDAGTLRISSEENLGSEKDGGASEFDSDRLQIGNGATLNTTASFTIDDADRGVEFNTGSLLDTNAGTTLTIASNVSGTALSKVGSGNLVLSGDNSVSLIDIQVGSVFAGSDTATGSDSTLNVGNGTTFFANGNSVSVDRLTGNGSIQNANALDGTISVGSGNSSSTFDGILADGAGAGQLLLTKVGTGTLTLTSDSTYTGDTLISGGLLTLSGNLDSSITVGSNATLAGEGRTSGNLTFANMGILDIDAGNGTNAFTADGTVDTTNGNVTVNVTSPPTSEGNITVFNYGTYTGDTNTDFDLAGGVVTSARGASFTDDVANTRINLSLGFENKTWAGGNATLPTTWDIGTTNNWTGGTDSLYQDGDFVTFDNTGIANNNVILSANQTYAPATITFENTSGDYTVSNGNALNTDVALQAETGGINIANSATGNVTLATKITGATSITHDGTGSLLLGTGDINTDVENNFTGLITVKSGATLVDNAAANASRALGADTGRADGVLTIEDGGTFDINARLDGADEKTYTGYAGSSIRVQGAGVDGNGAIVNNGDADTGGGFNGELILTGNTTFGGLNRFDIDGPLVIDATAQGVIDAGGNITITKRGVDQIQIGNQSGTAIAQFITEQGRFSATNDNSFGSAEVIIRDAGDIAFNQNRIVNNNITWEADDRSIIGQGNNANATVQFRGDLLIDGVIVNFNPNRNDKTFSLQNVITGNSSSRIDIRQGTTLVTTSANLTGYEGSFRLEEANGVLAVADGVTLTQDIDIQNQGGTDQRFIELQEGASAGEFSGNFSLLEDSDGDFNIRAYNGGNLTISGIISDDGDGTGLDIIGDGNASTTDGTVILTGNNTWGSGRVQVLEQTTLQVGNGGTNGTLGNNDNRNTFIDSGATLTFNRSDDVDAGGVMSGDGTISQIGTGVLTLSATTSTFGGTINVDSSSGGLNLTGTTSGNATVNINDGTFISGEGSITGSDSLLTIGSGSGATIRIDTDNSDALAISGNVDISNGTQTVQFTNTPTSSGNITVLTHSGAGNVTGTTANLQLDSSIATSTRGAQFDINSTAITVNLGFTDRTWSGNTGAALSSVWDGNNTTTWQEGDQRFVTGDFVTFDDSAFATFGADGNVVVTGAVDAGSVTFANTGSNEYTISGDAISTSSGGGILYSGNAGVTINSVIAGANTTLRMNADNAVGSMTLGANNTYAGGTTISTGRLIAGTDGALGDETSEILIERTTALSELVIGAEGINLQNDITISNAGIDKRIEVLQGVSTAEISGDIENLESSGGDFAFEVANNTTLTLSGILSGNRIDFNRHTNDGGNYVLQGNNTHAITDVNRGVNVRVEHTNAAGLQINLNRNNTLEVADSVTLQAVNGIFIQNQTANRTKTLSADTQGGNTTSTIAANVTIQEDINANFRLSADTGDTLNITGDITGSGDGGFQKIGGGTVALSGTNAYDGATNVDVGTLLINGDQTGSTGITTVASGATLGGIGSIGGNVVIGTGATHTAATTTTAGTPQVVNGDLDYNADSTFVWNLMDESTADGSGFFDQINVGGELDFNSNNTNIQIVTGTDVDFGDAFWNSNQSWQVWDLATLGGTLAGFDPMDFTFLALDHSGSGTAPVGRFSIFEVNDGSLDGNGIYLNFTGPIPEPSTYALFGLGLAGFGWFARRRRKQASDAVNSKK